MLRPSAYVDLRVWLEASEGIARRSSPPSPRQGFAQVSESFSEPVTLQIKHTETHIACMLNADLSADPRPLTSSEQSGEDCLALADKPQAE